MELNICYLYPELLSTYGDMGNLKILSYRATSRGITVNVYTHSVGDVFDGDKYDIVILGGGQASALSVVSSDMSGDKKQAVSKYIEDGKVMLAICGGYQLLGEYYTSAQGEKIDGLGILPIHTDASDKRYTGNIAVDIYGEKCVGFENHSGKTYIGELSPLGKVISGQGNNGEDGGEGVRYKNTFCTYLHGPFLSKNPGIADKILHEALVRKYSEVKLMPLDDEYEISAKKSILNKIKKG